jgi:adenosylcobyric acid synthase
MTTPAVMVLGCTSDAGKSWLATALCRWYRRQGIKVAPFKAQNMSNHARVVRLNGAPSERSSAHTVGEMGSAQYFQALAAGIEPDVRMNPILLKPEADTRSQVEVQGRVDLELTQMEWRERSQHLWTIAQGAYQELAAEYDLIVIEGAGSPAEINLAQNDYVNTQTALLAQAKCLLVSDIDRGGAFAHLYGTHALMDARVRAQVTGFVLNRFRGDASLLAPGPHQLQQLTGIPTVAVIPLVREHKLPEEDAVPTSAQSIFARPSGSVKNTVPISSSNQATPHVVIITPPHVSNLDEFAALQRSGVAVSFTRDPTLLLAADWVVLPGSKQTRADLAWLRAQGFAEVLGRYVAEGKPLLAICGGMQLLGERLDDPMGVEGSAAGTDAGLGLLPLITRFDAHKHLTQTQAKFSTLTGIYAPLSGIALKGYEIHCGQTQWRGDDGNVALINTTHAQAVGWQRDNILGLYVHGVLEQPEIIHRLFKVTPLSLESVFEHLADVIEQSF